MKHTLRVWALVTSLLLPALALANSPRDYLPLDPGSFFVALYYNHSFGNDLYSKWKYVNGNTNFYSNVGIFRGVYYTSLGPFTIDPQVIVPFGQAALLDKESSGLGDVTFASTIWFVNNQENKFIFAYTPFLTAPTGRYERTSAVNLGANRWSTKHELCVAKGFGDRTWLEIAANMQFYFDNTNAPDAGNRATTESKDPTFGLESHLSYNITKALFGSLDYYYAYGGETTLKGVRQKNWIDTHSVGATLAYMLNAHTQLMVDFTTDVAVYNGIRTNVLGARLGFIF